MVVLHEEDVELWLPHSSSGRQDGAEIALSTDLRDSHSDASMRLHMNI
jgi:hypothetical protein